MTTGFEGQQYPLQCGPHRLLLFGRHGGDDLAHGPGDLGLEVPVVVGAVEVHGAHEFLGVHIGEAGRGQQLLVGVGGRQPERTTQGERVAGTGLAAVLGERTHEQRHPLVTIGRADDGVGEAAPRPQNAPDLAERARGVGHQHQSQP